MSLTAVKRNKKYLEELAVADLTAQDIASKRQEIYLELIEASEEAKSQYQKYRDEENPQTARKFFMSWVDAIEKKAKLYGLDNVKSDNIIQFNQINNQQAQIPDTIPVEVGDRVARLLKDNHEQSTRNKYEEDRRQ